jgi:hypothetical protein
MPDEPLVIKFKLKNTGSKGIKTVKLLSVNGKPYCYSNCLVEAGANRSGFYCISGFILIGKSNVEAR